MRAAGPPVFPIRQLATVRLIASLAVLLVAAGVLAMAAPAHAAGPTLMVAPSTFDPAAESTITVKGSGFDATRNNKFGIYLVFGPKAGDFSTNANRYLAVKWVHPGGGAGGGEQVEMKADGSFSATLSKIRATYTDGDGNTVDCTAAPCYVMAFAAHGVPDRTQDATMRITFAKATAPSPTTAAVPSSGRVTTPRATASPTATTPSAAAPAPSASASATPTPPDSEVPPTHAAPSAAQAADRPVSAGAADDTERGAVAVGSSASGRSGVGVVLVVVVVAVLAAFVATVIVRRRKAGGPVS